MRLLLVHADHFAFEVTAEAGDASAGTGDEPTGTGDASAAGRMEDCVAAFVTVERGEETDSDAAVANAAAELRDATDRLNTRKAVLYPSAHLSDEPATPDAAGTVLRDLASELAADREVLRAPATPHTAFEVSCKGHPLSTSARRVTPRRGDGVEATDRIPSEWRLALPDGDAVALPRRNPVDALDEHGDRVSDAVRALVAREVGGESADERAGNPRDETEEPLRVDLLSDLGLAGRTGPTDNDPDESGAPRWYPRGKLVRDALAEYATDLAVDHGAMPVETPESADLVADGHLSVVRDSDVAASDLPLRLYELSTGTAPDGRRSGGANEATGRTHRQDSTVPAVHTAVGDPAQARAELRAQVELALRAAEELGLSYDPVVRTTRAFYDDNEAWVASLVEELGGPALLELLPERRGDWEFKVDFTTGSGPGGYPDTAAVELDAESAERFDVTDDAGEEDRHPIVLRFSPTGSIEDALAALLAAAAAKEVPRLPTWLSPTQVRFVPVGEAHVDRCDALAADLESVGIRADVDDRDLPVGERLAAAESDWVPYSAVVGDRETERDAEALKVTVRGEGAEREMTTEELKAAVLADVDDLPTPRRYLPKHLSERPDFA